MGVCEYCGEKAGWFRSSHLACVNIANATSDKLRAFVSNEIVAGKTLADLSLGIQQFLNNSSVEAQFVRGALQQGINDGIGQLALRSPVSVDERLNLEAIQRCYDLKPSPDKSWFAPAQLELSHILWLVFNDVPFDIDFTPDFNLQVG